ncbi:hypothetical protein Ga0609869_000078 [Rhodovulum iodosum]|uniref:Hedgehog/Intein (Hint) domain-containing protein n=1 Tax=Rhodovulum iodosum TaxID=68291 RepID=A0ABV3XN42_9RHOB|nr:Hint domain-containing protein [Rhodovulum robiginosum]RSK35862.1 Hint domain-containing protein [Rhodovulum robiginosum]
MARQQVTGPSSLTIGTGDDSVTGQYFASKLPATWSVSVLNGGGLDAADYTVTISSSGVLTITLLPGATVPPGGASMLLSVQASSGSGGGNNDSLLVTVTLAENTVPCFVAGTLIDTAEGPRPVETLRIGDRIATLDGGHQRLRWIGSRVLTPDQLGHRPDLRPVDISKDAFGPGRPAQDLSLSPQHRVYVETGRAELWFADSGVLVHALHLVNGTTVNRCADGGAVRYVHIAFDRHEIIFANGLATESLFPGDVALGALGRPDVEELFAIFPELRKGRARTPLHSRCLKRHEAAVLAAAL